MRDSGKHAGKFMQQRVGTEGRGMALRLSDVRCDPIADRALTGLMHDYVVVEGKTGLVLTRKSGDMKLFFNELADLHEWEFVQNKIMVRQVERLRTLLTTVHQQRESWKVRALMAEAQLFEAGGKISSDGRKNVGEMRYASLKRYLAKQFHPDFAPGQGIEKMVRSEIFKEIWNEVERLDQEAADAKFVSARTTVGV
jgi:hypothetical protein